MKVLVLAAEEKGNRHNRWIAPLESVDGVITRLVLKSRSYIPFVFRVLWEFYRFRPHVVLSVGPDLVGLTSLMIGKWLWRRPLVLILGGDPIAVRRELLNTTTPMQVFERLRYQMLYYLNSGYLYKHVRYFMVNSVYLHNQLLQGDPRFRDRHVFVVPQPAAVARRPTRPTLCDHDRSMRMLTVTNLRHPAKYRGVLELVEFLQRYANETTLDRRFIFDICGGGAWSEALRRRLGGIVWKDERLWIRYLGFVRNTDSMYRRAHLFLYASSLDSLPRVLLEAQSFGLPILVNDFEPFKEIIKEGHNGLLYRTGDFRDFRKRLDMLVRCPHLTALLSKNAVESLKGSYAVEVIGKRLEEMLQTILREENNFEDRRAFD